MKNTRTVSWGAVAAGAITIALFFQVAIAQGAIKTQYVEYMHGDKPLKGYLAYDDSVSSKRPGVLLVHYRGGLQGDTLKDTEMIAKMGYVVFAEDIFGKDIVPKTVPEMTALTDIYNKDRARGSKCCANTRWWTRTNWPSSVIASAGPSRWNWRRVAFPSWARWQSTARSETSKRNGQRTSKVVSSSCTARKMKSRP